MTRSGAAITVAVIDSGANVPHPHLPAEAMVGGVAFDPAGQVSDDWVDRLGHGTAVAAAIHEKAPAARLWAVRVFERRLATSVPALIRALDWAVERGARIVNLSLGTPNHLQADHLARAVERAVAAGTLIVSPWQHEGRFWYPGSLEGVLGVELDPGCPREHVRVRRLPDGRVVVRASPLPRPIQNVPPERNLHGISFAAANVTGCLAAALGGGDAPGPFDPARAIGALEAAASIQPG